MNGKINNWDDLRLFMAVAREGGLSPAAKVTGCSAATLGRRMLTLERRIGCELFVRHDRGYNLTARAKRLLVQLTEIEVQLDGMLHSPENDERPLVKLSAGTWTTLALIENLDSIAGHRWTHGYVSSRLSMF